MLDPRKSGNYVYDKYRFNFEPFYIGKGKGYRIKQHLSPSRLKSPCRKNSKLKKLISMGLYPIIIKIEQNLTEDEAFYIERRIISIIGRIDNGSGVLTNMTDGGEGVSGHIVSEETRAKMSSAQKGKVAWNKGVKYSEETRQKMSITSIAFGCGGQLRGKKLSKEHREKISKGLMGKTKGVARSWTTKLKIGLANRGKRHSEETKRKISVAKRGMTLSEETKRKISVANKGKTISEEAKRNISIKLRLYYSIHPKKSDGPLHAAIRVAKRFGISPKEYVEKTNDGLKRCSLCKKWKELELFHSSSHRCKACRKIKDANKSCRNNM